MSAEQLTLDNGEFYLVELNGEQTLHTSRGDAIDHLKGSAGQLDPEGEDIEIVEVTVSGEDWQIKQLAWQKIALELLNGGGL